MLEAYHKLKKKPSMIAGLWTTLQKIWNELAQKPVAKAVQNFHTCLQACMNMAGEHLEQFIWHIQYRFSNREQLFKYW